MNMRKKNILAIGLVAIGTSSLFASQSSRDDLKATKAFLNKGNNTREDPIAVLGAIKKEIATIDQKIEGKDDGKRKTIVLLGNSGAGKTTLMHYFSWGYVAC